MLPMSHRKPPCTQKKKLGATPFSLSTTLRNTLPLIPKKATEKLLSILWTDISRNGRTAMTLPLETGSCIEKILTIVAFFA